jgi:hypothetical protein
LYYAASHVNTSRSSPTIFDHRSLRGGGHAGAGGRGGGGASKRCAHYSPYVCYNSRANILISGSDNETCSVLTVKETKDNLYAMSKAVSKYPRGHHLYSLLRSKNDDTDCYNPGNAVTVWWVGVVFMALFVLACVGAKIWHLHVQHNNQIIKSTRVLPTSRASFTLVKSHPHAASKYDSSDQRRTPPTSNNTNITRQSANGFSIPRLLGASRRSNGVTTTSSERYTTYEQDLENEEKSEEVFVDYYTQEPVEAFAMYTPETGANSAPPSESNSFYFQHSVANVVQPSGNQFGPGE